MNMHIILIMTTQHDLHGPTERNNQWVQSVFARTTASTHILIVEVAQQVPRTVLFTEAVPKKTPP